MIQGIEEQSRDKDIGQVNSEQSHCHRCCTKRESGSLSNKPIEGFLDSIQVRNIHVNACRQDGGMQRASIIAIVRGYFHRGAMLRVL
jgi:hypothetical protein